MNFTYALTRFGKLTLVLLLLAMAGGNFSLRAEAADPPANGSGIPEETLTGLVNQLSDSLVTKVQNASCPQMGELLDDIKVASTKPTDPDSLITKVLTDVKTNPKLKMIVIQKLSEPLLNRLLDCNMVPLDLLAPS